MNAKQSKVPANDLQGPTPGYQLLNLSASYRNPHNGSALWFIKVDNVLNALAYNSVTIDTVRGKSPLGARSLKLGVKYVF